MDPYNDRSPMTTRLTTRLTTPCEISVVFHNTILFTSLSPVNIIITTHTPDHTRTHTHTHTVWLHADMCVCVAVFGSLSSTYITVGWLDCGWTVAERIREHRQATVAFSVDQIIGTTSRWTTPSWTTPQPCLRSWTTPYCSSFWTKWVGLPYPKIILV